MPNDFDAQALHQEARLLIDRQHLAHLSPTEQLWLEDHMRQCPECRRYPETTVRLIQELATFSFPMDSELAARTHAALARRAHELEAEHPRHDIFLRAFALACVFTVVGSALAWQGSAWIAQQAQLAGWRWQPELAILWILPSLVITMLLLVGVALVGTRRDERSLV